YPIITIEDQVSLIRGKTVLVCGVGGMGGWIVEALMRTGVGRIILADNGFFDKSNAHRQLGAHTENIGKQKAFATLEVLSKVIEYPTLFADTRGIQESNMDELLDMGVDLVLDLVEFFSPEVRILIHLKAEERNIPVLNANSVVFSTFVFPFLQPQGKRMRMEDILQMSYSEAKEYARRFHETGDEVAKHAIIDSVMRGLLPVIPNLYDGCEEEYWKRLQTEGTVAINAPNPMFAAGHLSNMCLLHVLLKGSKRNYNIKPLPEPGYVHYDTASRVITEYEGKWWEQ
ncbi:MAG: ThiF family adenylyltransferase, partial [Patescibacteria group bacterium]